MGSDEGRGEGGEGGEGGSGCRNMSIIDNRSLALLRAKDYINSKEIFVKNILLTFDGRLEFTRAGDGNTITFIINILNQLSFFLKHTFNVVD